MAVSIPKEKWGIISPEDLEKAEPKIEPGDIVIINTGWHKYYGDSVKYFCYSPGLYLEAGEWLKEKGVKAVGVDQQALDHPLATAIGPHGPGGPILPWVVEEYEKETGKKVTEEFALWEPCHRQLLGNGIVGFENVGGDIDKVSLIGLNEVDGDRLAFKCKLQSCQRICGNSAAGGKIIGGTIWNHGDSRLRLFVSGQHPACHFVDRTVTTGGDQTYHDAVRLDQPPSPAPAVVAGVQQERSLALAGRVADGVILVEGAGPTYVDWALDRAGRPDRFRVVTFTMMAVDDDRRTADHCRSSTAGGRNGLSGGWCGDLPRLMG